MTIEPAAPPGCLILSPQALATVDRSRYGPFAGLRRGAYVLADCESHPDVILIGIEVALALEASERLTRDGVAARVVSMPSWELFEDQPKSYRDTVLPPTVTARISIEEASTLGWDRYVGSDGVTLGKETFGASAPLQALVERFGFTVDQVVETAQRLAETHG